MMVIPVFCDITSLCHNWLHNKFVNKKYKNIKYAWSQMNYMLFYLISWQQSFCTTNVISQQRMNHLSVLQVHITFMCNIFCLCVYVSKRHVWESAVPAWPHNDDTTESQMF